MLSRKKVLLLDPSPLLQLQSGQGPQQHNAQYFIELWPTSVRDNHFSVVMIVFAWIFYASNIVIPSTSYRRNNCMSR
jgi:hypothetical protein